MCYYPQATGEAEGTHVIPSSQFQNQIQQSDNDGAVPLAGAPGTVFITHWDTAHAGGSPADKTRLMVKFAFSRVVHPLAYPVSQTPDVSAAGMALARPAKHPAATSRIFCWLRGVRWEPEPDGRSTDALLGCLNAHDDQPGRIAAIYALAARPEAVGALLADLQSHGQRAGILMQGDSGPLRGDDEALMADAVKWSEDAVVMEDAAYSLAAMEPSAEVCALVVDALHSQSPDDEWTLLNIVFVIGEHGPTALAAAGRLISLARSSTSHRVVRMCLASLTQMMDSTAAPELQERAAVAVAELLHGAPRAEDCRFASFQRRFFGKSDGHRGGAGLPLTSQSGLFCAHDQVRVMAAELANALATGAASATDALVAALADPCGYVSQIAATALLRTGGQRGIAAAARYWQASAWDGALRVGANY